MSENRRGPKGPHKLTPEQIKEIQEAPYYHGIGKDLAKKHGVSAARISQLRKQPNG